jgi:hypothetical protein
MRPNPIPASPPAPPATAEVRPSQLLFGFDVAPTGLRLLSDEYGSRPLSLPAEPPAMTRQDRAMEMLAIGGTVLILAALLAGLL